MDKKTETQHDAIHYLLFFGSQTHRFAIEVQIYINNLQIMSLQVKLPSHFSPIATGKAACNDNSSPFPSSSKL